MGTAGRSSRRGTAAHAVTALLALALAALPCGGTPRGEDDARVRAGVKLFRAFLAADLAIEGKADSDGRLLVVVTYVADRDTAESVAAELRRGGEGAEAATIRDLPVVVETSVDPTLAAYAGRPLAGVFIAEAPKDEALKDLVAFGIGHGTAMFSPFEGHVEKGVLGGLSIEAKVQPYVNERTLAASHIELKPFFLRVAKLTR